MMTYDARLTMLSTHADRLNQGEEQARRFMWRQAQRAPDLVALMSLAHRLKAALRPVPVPDEFRARLRYELVAHEGQESLENRRSRRRPLYFSLAAVGSVLPILGIVVWRRRRRSDAVFGAS